MYELNHDQIKSLNDFVGKIPDSIIKYKVEDWINDVTKKEVVTSEQLANLLSLQNGLPKDLQSFPESFAFWLKNGYDITAKSEETVTKKSKTKKNK